MSNLVVDATGLAQDSRILPASPYLRTALTVLLVCAGYYVGGVVGIALMFPFSPVAIIWPPNSILLAALLLTPTRTWWLYLLAAIPTHLHLVTNFQPGVPVLTMLCQVFGNILQAVIAGVAVRRFAGAPPRFDNLQGLTAFILLAAIAAPCVVAALVSYLFVLTGWVTDFWVAWRLRFLANVFATLTITPLILLALAGGIGALRKIPPPRHAEFGLLVCSLLAVGIPVFGLDAAGPRSYPALLYTPLPLLLWAAARFGPAGLSLCLLLVAFLSLSNAIAGRGPFITQSPAENVLSLQIFLMAISLPLMFLAAVIQERQDKEDALRESEQRYRTIVEGQTDLVCRFLPDATLTFVNATYARYFGKAPGELIGQSFLTLIPEGQREPARKHIESLLESRGTGSQEHEVLTPGGEIRWQHWVNSPILNSSGRVVEFQSVGRDVTERKRAENLRAGQSYILELIVTNAPLEDILTNLARFIESHSNGMLCSILLLDEDGLHARHGAAPTLPESYTKTIDGLTIGPRSGSCGTAMYLGKPVIVTDILEDPLWDDYRDLAAAHGLRSCWSTPIFSPQGKVLGSFAMYYRKPQNPTPDDAERIELATHVAGIAIERKHVDQALRNSESRLKLAMDSARIGYWETDLTTGRVTWSESMERIFGLSAGEFAGTAAAFYELVHPEDRDELRKKAAQCVKTLKAADAEYRIVLSNGEVRWIAGRGQAFTERSGRASRLLGMAVDITERKRAEEEIQRLKERLEAENVYLRAEVSGADRFGELTGQSEAIEKVIHQVEQVAATDMTVLLLGETGTGKELVARAVHAGSTRKDHPLVKVNCSALPSELIESELFGHEKGAFTGATARQIGRFELADGGTLFLDEIGELPLKLQAKLLRVLQEGEFERLGSAKTIRVDVRVIAATNRDLLEAIQRGRFRADLYYRLNVYPIQLPPLRERIEDIPLLAMTFLIEAGQRLGRRFKAIPEDVLVALRRYDWPGNARELQNVIERAAVVSPGPELRLPEGWAPPLTSSPQITQVARVEENRSLDRTSVSGPSLGALERKYILRILEQSRWRIEGASGAAAVLGLNPSTLRSRIQRLGIRRPPKPREYN